MAPEGKKEALKVDAGILSPGTIGSLDTKVMGGVATLTIGTDLYALA